MLTSKSHRRICTAVFGIFLCLVAIVGSASAQQLTAQIKGTVMDASGSAVPDAQVKATSMQTNVAVTVSSKSDGGFEFLQLPVGTYSVTASKAGFSNFTEKDIKLDVNQVFNVPITIQVGTVSQAIEVEANAAQVETTTTQLDTVVEAQKIVDLPLNGRNWVQLQQLAPGVVSTSDRFGTNYATNGSESQQNSFLINGADSIDLPLNSPLIIPSPDAIGEFSLIDSTINPEYGRNSGGVLNALIKAGTNRFHGDAFEFYRDNFLNGRNLYQVSQPIFHQNQFGGTLGGPIWKDHTFFFISYQGTRNRQPESGASGTATVFSNAQRNGQFSDLSTSTGTSPFPLVGDSGQTYPAGTAYSTIFSQGFIPTRDFNPIAAKLMATYVPQANLGGNLYSFNPISTNTIDQGIARLDHTFGTKDALWFTMIIQHQTVPETLPFTGATVPGFGDESVEAPKQFTADWTHTFNPTTLNEVRLSYVRFNFQAVNPQQIVQPSSLGFNINPENAASGVPFISLNGYFSLGFSTNGPQPRIDETTEAADNFSKAIGNHTLKFGFDGKRYNVDNPFAGNNNGNYTFNGAGLYSTSDPGADFLLGIPDSYAQGSGGWIVARTYEYYFYAQDNWKVSQNLTVNYGAGYQIDTPLVNQHFDQLDVNCFVPGEQSKVFPTAPAGLVFPGDPGCSKSGYSPHYDHIGPRVGFAYSPGSDPSKKFVIRGGFGIYFNRSEEELALQNLGAYPFSITSPGVSGLPNTSPAFANPFVDIATGVSVPNPFPFSPAKPGSTNVDFSQFYPLNFNTVSPNFTDPYAMNFNLNIQKELPGAMLLTVGYVGAQGRHLELTYEANPISPAGSAACAASSSCISERSNQHVDFPSHALLAPGDIFQSVGVQATDGVSSYNSLQAKLEKRFSHGLGFLASYTWSHSIDDTSGFENSGFGNRGEDPFNFAVDKGDSVFDARQRFVVSYDYEVPHLSRFWNNGFVRSAFDGWHVAGITTLQSGFPITVQEIDFNSLQCDNSYYGCWDTPNVTANPGSLNPRTSSLVNTATSASNKTAKPYYYFNTNVFSKEAIGQLGNAGRNNFHGPGINNTDLVLSKRVYINKSETRFFELRLEGYNVFNHTQFMSVSYQGSGVNGDISSSNFGRVLSAAPGRTVQLGAKFYF